MAASYHSRFSRLQNDRHFVVNIRNDGNGLGSKDFGKLNVGR